MKDKKDLHINYNNNGSLIKFRIFKVNCNQNVNVL